jgi:hypothetical protein
MAILRRIGILWVVLSALLGWGTATAAAAGSNPGSACGNGSVSALSQYCEQIPSSTGGQRPAVGTPAVGSSLPAATPTVASPAATPPVALTASTKRHLRALPAAVHSRPITGPVTDEGIISQSTPLLFILIAIALGLAGVAYERRRRRRST